MEACAAVMSRVDTPSMLRSSSPGNTSQEAAAALFTKTCFTCPHSWKTTVCACAPWYRLLQAAAWRDGWCGKECESSIDCNPPPTPLSLCAPGQLAERQPLLPPVVTWIAGKSKVSAQPDTDTHARTHRNARTRARAHTHTPTRSNNHL
jgi:hypothetical protein